MDFLGAGVTANSRSTNGYNPRLRQAYATYDNDNWHFHMLAGQSWSLITQFKVGITPREEHTPLTIDGQEAVGASTVRAAGKSDGSETGTRSPGSVCQLSPRR